jgi:hypothetical protein
MDDETIEAIIGIERAEPLQISVTVADNGYVIQSDRGIKVAMTLRQMLRIVARVVRDDEKALRDAFLKAFEAQEVKGD